MTERSKSLDTDLEAAEKAALAWLIDTLQRDGSEPDSANKPEACRMILSARYGVAIPPCIYNPIITHRWRL